MLYRALIFSLPFSATSIVNIGNKGFPAWLFLGLLWMIREAGPELLRFRFKYPTALRPQRLALGLFCAVAALSLVIPVLFAGGVEIQSPILLDGGSEPLHLASRNFTSLLYLYFGSLLAILVARRNIEAPRLVATLKIYLYALLFVCGWGIFQWVLLQFQVPYPAFLFNNSATETAQGFATFLDGVPRISSVAVEPSILAQILLTFLPFVILTGVLKYPVLPSLRNLLLGSVIGLVLLLSTSFSAYIGIAIVLAIIPGALYFVRVLRLKHLVVLTSVPLLALFSYVAIPFVSDFVNSQLLTKGDSYSGIERARTVILAYTYFVQFPVLGVGWGSVTSHDLILNLLSNCGILGFLCFALFVGVVVRKLFVSVKSSARPNEKSLKVAMGLSLITLIVMNIFTGFAFVFGHMWLIFGLTMAATAMRYDPQGSQS
jgi:O-antigen ligase